MTIIDLGKRKLARRFRAKPDAMPRLEREQPGGQGTGSNQRDVELEILALFARGTDGIGPTDKPSGLGLLVVRIAEGNSRTLARQT
jgi:hypothetical protein